jgi:predicted Zn-ribbon and HTH transcriptional regulator
MLWFACTVMVLLAGIYVVRPLFKESRRSLDIELLAETELDRLFDRKTIIYLNLKDLGFEHEMGRLSDADFRQLETGYKNEAANILQRLENLSASENLDEAIEKEIASRKARLNASGSKVAEGASRCPSCGAETISDKKFCADCGRRL